MSALLEAIFRHHLWANLRTVDACAGLDPAQMEFAAIGTYGSIAGTLLHIASAEGSYVRWATQDSAASYVHESMPFPGLEPVRESLRASGERLIMLAQPEHNDRLVTYTFSGRPSTNPLSMILTKALAHAAEHRTHVAASLTQIGVEPPELDAWLFVQESKRPG